MPQTRVSVRPPPRRLRPWVRVLSGRGMPLDSALVGAAVGELLTNPGAPAGHVLAVLIVVFILMWCNGARRRIR